MSEEDKKIIQKIYQKDASTITKFYRKNQHSLLLFLTEKLSSRDDAEEVLQDTFIAFFESLRSFNGNCSLKTYLFSIARKKAVDKLRKKRLKQFFLSHLPPFIIDCVSTVFLEDEIDKSLLSNKIEYVFSSLPKKYSNVLRLKYIYGYKVKEISKTLGFSFKATESLLFRARKAFVVVFKRL